MHLSNSVLESVPWNEHTQAPILPFIHVLAQFVINYAAPPPRVTQITFQAGGRQHNRLKCCQNLMSFCYFLLHLNLTNTIQNLDCSLQVVRKWAEWCTENLNKVTLVSLTWHQTKVCNLQCLENSNSSYYGTQLGTFLTQANCMFPMYNGATAELNTDW